MKDSDQQRPEDWISPRGRIRAGYPSFRRHGALPAGPLSDPADLLALFSYLDRPTGIAARLSQLRKARRRDDHDGFGPYEIWSVAGVLEHGSKRAGSFGRHFKRYRDGRLLAFHDSLLLGDENTRGRGFGSRYCQRVERGYSRKGVCAILLSAADELGGYVWARQGFQFTSIDNDGRGGPGHNRQTAAVGAQRWWFDGSAQITAKELVRDGRLAQPVFDHLEQWITRALCSDQIAPLTPQQIVELGRDDPWLDEESGRETWIGKQLLLASDWNGTKILNDSFDHKRFDPARLDLAQALLR
jgi:hypothetical protein